MPHEECPLCDEFFGDAAGSEYRRVYREGPDSRVLFETAHLLAIADLSPLSLGHSLILPKNHCLNFAQVANAYPDEVRQTADRLTVAVSDIAGCAVVLEHGSSTDMDGSACIAHAHWHIIATDIEAVKAQMSRDGLTHVDVDLENLAARHRDDIPYFLVGDGQNFSLFGVDQRMPRQYLRAVAAKTLGLTPDTHDWAVVQRHALFHDTFNGLAARL